MPSLDEHALTGCQLVPAQSLMETEVSQRHMEEISHAVISSRENGFGILECGFMLCHSYYL